MTQLTTRKYQKKVSAAEGYLMLEMPDHALHELSGKEFPEDLNVLVICLQADAYRMKEDYSTALASYHQADAKRPNDITVLLGMSWCYKRIDQLEKAIEKTKQAYDVSPNESIILYNLACYYTLADDKSQALSWLGRALRMDDALLKLIPKETDFDSLRDDKDFLFLVETAGAEVI